MRASISIRRQVWLSKSASWAIVRSTPALTGNDLALSAAAVPAEDAAVGPAEGDPPGHFNRRAAFGAPFQRRRSGRGNAKRQLETRQPPVNRFARRQRGKRFVG